MAGLISFQERRRWSLFTEYLTLNMKEKTTGVFTQNYQFSGEKKMVSVHRVFNAKHEGKDNRRIQTKLSVFRREEDGLCSQSI